MKANKCSLAKIITIKLALTVGILFISVYPSVSEDLRTVINLEGMWKFSIGDDINWAKYEYDDTNWDKIHAPDSWEQNGYVEYDGFAWYRKKFKFPQMSDNQTFYIELGRIDDVDEVFFNGQRIGKSGEFAPDYYTAYNVHRKYVVPKEFINFDAGNLVAVRVFDEKMGGGIVEGRLRVCIDEDENILLVNLNGKWKFKDGDNKSWAARSFDDQSWKSIQVPGGWETQGYADYDGYGWYRKTFKVPENINSGDLILFLGKIDDYDDVYLNGKKIGSIYDLKKHSEFRIPEDAWLVRRGYSIPANVLEKGRLNVLAVRVYDKEGGGGIYEGPIGIMTRSDYNKYEENHRWERNFVEDFLYNFFKSW